MSISPSRAACGYGLFAAKAFARGTVDYRRRGRRLLRRHDDVRRGTGPWPSAQRAAVPGRRGCLPAAEWQSRRPRQSQLQPEHRPATHADGLPDDRLERYRPWRRADLRLLDLYRRDARASDLRLWCCQLPRHDRPVSATSRPSCAAAISPATSSVGSPCRSRIGRSSACRPQWPKRTGTWHHFQRLSGAPGRLGRSSEEGGTVATTARTARATALDAQSATAIARAGNWPASADRTPSAGSEFRRRCRRACIIECGHA